MLVNAMFEKYLKDRNYSVRELLSFPKIISGRSDDVIRPILGCRQWLQIAGRRDVKAHLSLMPGACALDCNRPHRRKEYAADGNQTLTIAYSVGNCGNPSGAGHA